MLDGALLNRIRQHLCEYSPSYADISEEQNHLSLEYPTYDNEERKQQHCEVVLPSGQKHSRMHLLIAPWPLLSLFLSLDKPAISCGNNIPHLSERSQKRKNMRKKTRSVEIPHRQ